MQFNLVIDCQPCFPSVFVGVCEPSANNYGEEVISEGLGEKEVDVRAQPLSNRVTGEQTQ